MEDLLASIPEYAKDLKLNLTAVLEQPELTEQQTWGTVVATAIASRNGDLIEYLLEQAKTHLSSEALHAAKGTAAIMGMSNIWDRFPSLSGNPNYEGMPANLRMQIIQTHGIDPMDFELWCVAVSAINACSKSVSSHEAVLRQHGMTEVTIAAAIRIAAVIHGLAVVLDAELAAPTIPTVS